MIILKVIDISAWQENINWQAIKDADIKGVIIKIGEKTHLDDMFITHVNNAAAYNLPFCPMVYITMLMLQQLMKL